MLVAALAQAGSFYAPFLARRPQPVAPESIQRTLELLAQAERPLIILGKGAAYAQADADIRAFIEKTGIPFLPMSMAKGLLPDDHPCLSRSLRGYSHEASRPRLHTFA